MDSRRTPRTQRPISWRSSAGPLAIAVCLFVFAAAMTDSDHFDPTDGHSSLACSSCHVLTASTERTYYPTTDLSGQCRACHNTMQAAPDELALSFHGAKDADCVRCHSFHETSRISLNSVELRFDFSSQVRSAQCFSCHGEGIGTAGLSSGHQAAAELYHSDQFGGLTASQSCLVCHSESAEALTGLLGKAVTRAPRFSEHGTHPVGVPVKTGAGRPGNKIRSEIDARIRIFNGIIECQSCHNLTAPTRGRLVAFEESSDLCLGCHQPG